MRIFIQLANKTIYVRDEKQWEEARRLAGADGLSTVIHALLQEWVRRKKAAMDTKNMRPIELPVGGKSYESEHDDVAEQVAFTGRLLATSEDFSVDQMPKLHIYQAASGKLVVYRSWLGTPASDQGATYRQYRDYEALTADPTALDTKWIEGDPERDQQADHSPELRRQLQKALGRPVVVRLD